MRIFTVYYLCFLGFTVFYQLLAESRADKASSQNRGKTYFEWTHLLITLTYYALNILAIAEYFIAKRKINVWVSLAGIALFALGLWGRSYAIKTLQKYWSGDIEIRQGHGIIREGPYAYVRHPAYLSMIIKSAGLCLVPNSYYSLIFLFLCYMPVLADDFRVTDIFFGLKTLNFACHLRRQFRSVKFSDFMNTRSALCH